MTDREFASEEWPVFADCALLHDCECARRIEPYWRGTECLVPALNAMAAAMGWKIPYPRAKERPQR